MNFKWIIIKWRQRSWEFNWFLKIFMKILWEGDVKPTHSERERKKFSFLLDYFFADDVRYDSAKPLLYLVQNPAHGGCSVFVLRSHCEVLILGVGLHFHTLPSQGDHLVSYLPEPEWSTYPSTQNLYRKQTLQLFHFQDSVIIIIQMIIVVVVVVGCPEAISPCCWISILTTDLG